METKYQVIAVDGTITDGTVDWPEGPDYEMIRRLIEPLLGVEEPLEHVTVLHNGGRRDMFVSEYGHMELTTRPPLPINRAATQIYRNNWITQYPGTDPESMPNIAGIAVLFPDRVVWT